MEWRLECQGSQYGICHSSLQSCTLSLNRMNLRELRKSVQGAGPPCTWPHLPGICFCQCMVKKAEAWSSHSFILKWAQSTFSHLLDYPEMKSLTMSLTEQMSNCSVRRDPVCCPKGILVQSDKLCCLDLILGSDMKCRLRVWWHCPGCRCIPATSGAASAASLVTQNLLDCRKHQ